MGWKYGSIFPNGFTEFVTKSEMLCVDCMRFNMKCLTVGAFWCTNHQDRPGVPFELTKQRGSGDSRHWWKNILKPMAINLAKHHEICVSFMNCLTKKREFDFSKKKKKMKIGACHRTNHKPTFMRIAYLFKWISRTFNISVAFDKARLLSIRNENWQDSLHFNWICVPSALRNGFTEHDKLHG